MLFLTLFPHRFHLEETRIDILDHLADHGTFSGGSPAFHEHKYRYLLLFDQKLLLCQLFFCSGKARFDFFLIRFFHCFPFLKHKKSPFSYTFSSSIHISAITFRRCTDLCLLLCCHSSFSFSQNFRNIKTFSHFLYFFQNLTVLFFYLYFRILVFFYKRFL